MITPDIGKYSTRPNKNEAEGASKGSRECIYIGMAINVTDSIWLFNA